MGSVDWAKKTDERQSSSSFSAPAVPIQFTLSAFIHKLVQFLKAKGTDSLAGSAVIG